MIGATERDLTSMRKNIDKLILDIKGARQTNLQNSSHFLVRIGEYRTAHSDGSSMVDLSSELSDVLKRLSLRRIHLLRELSQLYIIENFSRFRTIRGLALPSITGLKKCELRDEESISAALGFLIHRISITTRIVDFPVAVRLISNGSKSVIKNPSSVPSLIEFPLYYKGVDKTKFIAGVGLLRDSIFQFIQGRHKRVESSDDLLELADMLLVRELFNCS